MKYEFLAKWYRLRKHIWIWAIWLVEFVLRPYSFSVTHEILNKLEALYIQHVIANEMLLRAQECLTEQGDDEEAEISFHTPNVQCGSWKESY